MSACVLVPNPACRCRRLCQLLPHTSLLLGICPYHDTWGCPRHPLFFINYHKVVFVELRFYHFTYYVLCLERLFTFSFVCLFAGHILVGSYPSCVGESHAPLFRLNTPLLRLYLT